jgi:hypothetical protein
MRTANPNLVILTVLVDGDITGTAIDDDILVNFAVANTEVNQRLFVPKAQLVVTGKFRLGQEPKTIGIWITRIIAIVTTPIPVVTIAEFTDPSAITADLPSPQDAIPVEVGGTTVEVEPTAVVLEAPESTKPASKQKTRAKKSTTANTAKKAKAASLPC